MTNSTTSMATKTTQHIEQVDTFSAHNYSPLPVVIAEAKGSWVTDVDGNRHLDMLSGYSALNFGHAHPKIVEAFVEQAQRLTLTSRAFQNDQLGPFSEKLSQLAGMDQVLPMNTGAEAVETALKLVRKWGNKVKGIPDGKQEIICMHGNFHGRTIAVISFSSTDQYRDGFGPLTPGFKLIKFGDIDALRHAITSNTAAVLIEPIQGEGGIVVPPDGYLPQVRELCSQQNVLMIGDEIQTGLGRTGRIFACEHENVQPDVYILGKALGGGMFPVSAVLANKDVMGVFQPGDHGSTFGGNPLACRVAQAAVDVLIDEKLPERAAKIGEPFMDRLRAIDSHHIKEVRGRGLLIGIELHPDAGGADKYTKALMREGVLCKETVKHVMRVAPPLNISEDDLDWAYERFVKVLSS